MVFQIFIDVVAVLLSIAGFIGCIIPIIPGPPLSYIALLLVYFFNNSDGQITGSFLLFWGVVTVVVTILDYFLQPVFTKIAGGSPLAVRFSIAGMLVGLIFFPPIGILLGAFIGALVAELFINNKPLQNSLLAAFGTFLGFIFGTGLKMVCSAIMLYYLIRFIV